VHHFVAVGFTDSCDEEDKLYTTFTGGVERFAEQFPM